MMKAATIIIMLVCISLGDCNWFQEYVEAQDAEMQVVDYADLEDDVGDGKNLKDMVLTRLWDHAD